MKFVDSTFEIIEQKPGLDGIYKHIEKAARLCYKSENNITETSAEKMVNALIENQHTAMLEHATVYLKYPENEDFVKYHENQYSKLRLMNDGYFAVTTNFRVLMENHGEDDLQYICEPTEYHQKRYTVKFVTSIGITREILRHRKFSFANESTRYCNYSKGKFNNELTYVIPQGLYSLRNEYSQYVDLPLDTPKDYLLDYKGESLVHQMTCEDRAVAAGYENLKRAEEDYMYLTSGIDAHKLMAQDARDILPLVTKSEIIVTGFKDDWIHFFNLRSYIAITGKPHPDIEVLANNLLDEFLERNYIKYEELYKKDKI